MRGIVFAQLMAMVEEEYGYELAHKVLSNVRPDSSEYIDVATYPFHEMVSLVTQVSIETDLSNDQLLRVYGQYLFSVFTKKYPSFFTHQTCAFDFLASLEDSIHPEVHRLYPDAELPKFDIEYDQQDQLIMVYHSDRKMSAFAEGLIQGCLIHFNEMAEMTTEDLSKDGTRVKFIIKKNIN